MQNDSDREITAIRAVPTERPSTRPLTTATFARLVSVIGHEVGRSYPLGPRTVVLGRARDAQIMLSGDDISRHHASVARQGGGFVIDDLGSANGTFVNGAPVTRQVLTFGDRIQLGGSATFVFTRQDDLEERALQFQKLETLSKLAGGLAHDFKNVANAISLAAQNLEAVARRDGQVTLPDLLQGLADIRDAANAASEISGRMLGFGRSEVLVGTRQQLATIIANTLRLLQRSFGTSISVRVDVDPSLAVKGDAGALQQMLMNLCMNAVDAMRGGGGELALLARTVRLERSEALQLRLSSEGTFVELRVRDTGVGMDEHTRARLFEPFFTTKPPGQGTGLGLFSVFGVVRALGGTISVDSELGRGTTFRILLPSSAQGQ